MNISAIYAPIILFFVAVAPAYLAYRVALVTERSKFASTCITFALGLFTWIGGWLYLAYINRPKKKVI